MMRGLGILLIAACVALPGCSTRPQRDAPQGKNGGLLPFGSFNPPQPNAHVKGRLLAGGWAIHESGIQSVELYMDRQFFMKAEVGVDRPDVRVVYGKNYRPEAITGWDALIDVGGFQPGPHELLAKVTAKDGSNRDLVNPIVVEK